MDNELFNKAIVWAEKKGFKKIRANTENFESPSAMIPADKESVIIPDITGMKRGHKSYIEIVSKAENKQALISKWKLFYTLANRKGGKLYLLAARGHKAFTNRIIKEHDLEHAMVVSI